MAGLSAPCGAGMKTHTTFPLFGVPLHCIAPAPALQGLHPVTDDRVVHRRGGGEGARVVSHGHSFSSLDFALLTHLLCFGSVYATCPRDAFANFRRLFTAFQVRTTLCDLGGELAQTLLSSPRCDVDSVACPDRASALDPGPGKRSILVWMFESRLTSLHLRGPPPTVLSSLSALPRTAAARHSCGPRPKA